MKNTLYIFSLLFTVLMACNSGNKALREDARASLEGADISEVMPELGDADLNEVKDVFAGPTTTADFGARVHEYGTVVSGDVVRHTFVIKNTGKEQLVLSNVKPSCGCTTPEWSRDPIPPGGEGKIDVEFKTAGKSGQQIKTVTVTANTDPAQTVLTLKGKVNKSEASS